MLLACAHLAVAQAPNWDVNPSEFEHSMTVTGVIVIDHTEVRDVDDMQLAAFVGSEARGVTTQLSYIDALDRYFYSMLVYGTAGEDVTFQYYDPTNGTIDLLNEFQFVVDGDFGSLTEPLLVNNIDSESMLLDFSFKDLIYQHTDFSALKVTVTVPEETDLTALVGNFSLSDGALALVNDVLQTSDVTANDFSSAVEYGIVSSDLDTTTYQVEVVKAGALITAYDFDRLESTNVVFDAPNQSIALDIPDEEDITDLTAVFSLSENARAEISSQSQTSGSTANNFTNEVEYTIISEIDEPKTWKVSVSPSGTDITSFSVYPAFEEVIIDSDVREITIYIPKSVAEANLSPVFILSDGATAFVADAEQTSGSSTHDFGSPLTYDIVSKAGHKREWTVTVIGTDPAFTSFSLIEPEFSTVLIDEETRTIRAFVPAGTDLTQLTPEFELSTHTTGVTLSGNDILSGETLNLSSTVQPVIQSRDGHTTIWTIETSISETDFFSFAFESLPFATTEIDPVNHIVTVFVAPDTDVSSLAATFDIPVGTTLYKDGILQESGTTTNNFNIPVEMTIIATDDIEQVWTINVQEAFSVFTSFAFDETVYTNADINTEDREVVIYIPDTIALAALTPVFTLSTGATLEYNSALLESGAAVLNFTDTVEVAIVSEAGKSENWNIITRKTWAEVEQFTLSNLEINSSISATNQRILLTSLQELSSSRFAPKFVLSDGATAFVNGIEQVSGVTQHNFSSRITYLIVSAAGHSKEWTVELEVGSEFYNYRFPAIEDQLVETNDILKTIDVFVPLGTDLSALVATYEVSDGSSVQVGSRLQTSGESDNDFSDEVRYRITSAIGELETWTVEVFPVDHNLLSFSLGQSFELIELDSENRQLLAYVPQEVFGSVMVTTFELSEGANLIIEDKDHLSGDSLILDKEKYILEVRSKAGHTSIWTLDVQPTAPAIVNVDFPNLQFYTTTINGDKRHIDVFVRDDVEVSELEFRFQISETSKSLLIDDDTISNPTSFVVQDTVRMSVVAIDGHAQDWTMSFSPTTTDLFAYNLVGVDHMTRIDPEQRLVTLQVPVGTDLSDVTATFVTSSGARLYRGLTEQISGVTTNNFNAPLTLRVVATDDIVSEWRVEAIEVQAELTDFSFADQPYAGYDWDVANRILYVFLPDTADLTSLTPVFEISDGATAFMNGSRIESDDQPLNFSSTRELVITSQAGNTDNRTILVRHVQADIITFNLSNLEAEVTVDPSAQRVDIMFPPGQSLEGLAAIFELSEGATASIGDTEQINGVSTNDYSNTLTFTVTSLAGHTKEWTITAEVEVLATPLSVEEVEPLATIYPIPTRDYLNIEMTEWQSGNVLIEIVNLEGRTVLSSEVNSLDLAKLNVNGLPVGMYVLLLRSENHVERHKFLKVD